MTIEPILFTDKQGRRVELRAAELKDASTLIEYLKVTSAETPYLIREPDEITISVENEEKFIQEKIDSERELMLIALVDEKHVGNCSLMNLSKYRRYMHRCEVAIALYKDFCGCGIGKRMLETVLTIAAEFGYEQAELEVVADNTNAIALYEKIGFQKFGIFPDNIKLPDGTYKDAYWMMKKLKNK